MHKMSSTSQVEIEGVWLIDTEPFGEPCILVIMADGRTVQFPKSSSKPRANQTMRLWHSEYDGKQVRFRPSPSAEGWFRGIEAADDGWVMTAETDGVKSRFHCTPFPSHLLPEWYEEMLAINLEKMAAFERGDSKP
ncbi:MAG: hypothetical protein Q7Q71_07035 [Verrucomicrobiota bacterium JB023]|nr:hypothetical protein [Verrucomicrobiota bacterium JB023]